MLRKDFLYALRQALSFLPEKDIDERIRFYCEMIDDGEDDGLSEEEAVARIGDIDTVVANIIADTPIVTLVKEQIKAEKRLKTREIVLLAVGSPVWVPVLIAVFAVLFSLYISLWAVVISLWSVVVSLVGTAIGGLIGGIVLAVTQNAYAGLACVAGGMVCAALAILLFYGCKAATKGAVVLIKRLVSALKNKCVGKEKV